MFNEIGKKIQALATILAIIGMAASVIAGIVVLMDSVSGLLIIVLGVLLSWIGSFFTYGFGILVEHAEVSLGKAPSHSSTQRPTQYDQMSRSTFDNKAAQAENNRSNEPKTPHIPSWECTHCGHKNPLGIHKCENCGKS